MEGLMQAGPLVLTNFFERAERLFAPKTVTTVTGRGLEVENYGEWAEARAAVSLVASTT